MMVSSFSSGGWRSSSSSNRCTSSVAVRAVFVLRMKLLPTAIARMNSTSVVPTNHWTIRKEPVVSTVRRHRYMCRRLLHSSSSSNSSSSRNDTTSTTNTTATPTTTTEFTARSRNSTISASSLVTSSFSNVSQWFQMIGQRLWQIYTGDDHTNPKKIVERKYMYLIMIAMQFRTLRLKQQLNTETEQRNDNNISKSNSSSSIQSKDALYEQAIDELEKLHQLDKTTNVDLRLLLQDMLLPQVQQIFSTFCNVDNSSTVGGGGGGGLQIPQSIESYSVSSSTRTSSNIPNMNTAIPTSTNDSGNNSNHHDSVMDPILFHDIYKDLLLQELDDTQQQLSSLFLLAQQSRGNNDATTTTSTTTTNDNHDNKYQNQMNFLQTKEEAIVSLLQYHQWDVKTSSIHFADATTGMSTPNLPLLDPFGMKIRNGVNDDDVDTTTTTRLLKQYQTINICRSALIRKALGYSVLCLRSSIPNGGRGLFLDGTCYAGTIVAFQPGDVWPKEHLMTDAPEVMEHFGADESIDDDCQISLRFDDYVVDSRQSPVVVLCRDGSLNPFALGNMVNHPTVNPPTNIPNCQSTMLNYTAKMMTAPSNQNHHQFVKYIPNSYAKLPTWQSSVFDLGQEVLMHGLCLVSRTDITNEELFYDYRLQSDVTPEWYSIVQYPNNQLHDQQVVFFR